MADATETRRNQFNEPILRVENLVKHYSMKKEGFFQRQSNVLRAVDDVSFTVYQGETVGLVEESGCGKSTLAQTILRLVEATSGRIYYKGRNILDLSSEEMRLLRREIQIIFQDPYASLNPRMSVRQIITEPWEIFPDILARSEWNDRVHYLLSRVGLNPNDAGRYPHQFSGGQHQHIGIARTLALNPKLIICDEPVSALDVSIQAQVINLLKEIQEEFDLSYVFIAHDLSVVKHISDHVIVMYLGKIVEIGMTSQVYKQPTHPYTQALLSAVPITNPSLKGKRSQIRLESEIPSPANPPSGCRFRTRC